MKLFPSLQSVSVLIPVCNEIENLPLLIDQLNDVMTSTRREYELLFVDDGSTDGSAEYLRDRCRLDARIRCVEFRRNFGQTAAMQAGIDHAQFEYLVMIDADLQNEPSDIPMMLNKLDQGYDLVHGWRKDRHDAWLSRKIPSLLANRLISQVTRFPVHDLGCTLKAMRREIACELELYGEMHRFIPILAHHRGAKCIEVVTRHHPRRFGKTKYGIDRTLRVLLDLTTVKYMISFYSSPMKFFGKLGFISFVIGSLVFVSLLGMKVFGGVNMTGNPFLLLTCVSMFASLQFFSMGILGEIAARNSYAIGQLSANGKRSYAVRSRHNFYETETLDASRSAMHGHWPAGRTSQSGEANRRAA